MVKPTKKFVGGGGYIIYDEVGKKEIHREGFSEFPTTGNKMELMGFINAIRYMEANNITAKKIRVNSDSQYFVLAAKERIIKWKENGWRNSSGLPPKNIDLIKEIDEINQRMKKEGVEIQYSWIRAHLKKEELQKIKNEDPEQYLLHYFNEEADAIAVKEKLSKLEVLSN